MMVLLVVAMIGGMLFSIIWPIFWPMIHTRLVLGSLQPPADATAERRGDYFRTVLKKAIDNNLDAETIARAAANYAHWLDFECRNYPEAKKAYAKLDQLCSFKGSNGQVRTMQADGRIASAYIDHYFYLTKKGKPPDPQIALQAQKQQIEAAREMGFTNDGNDVERQQRTLEAISTFYCDNKKFAEALPFMEQAISIAMKHSTLKNQCLAMVKKARILSGLGKTEEADKLFQDAVKKADTAFGGGSDPSEMCLHFYSDSLIADGAVDRGIKVKQQQDDLRVW